MRIFKVAVFGRQFEVQQDDDGKFILPDELKQWDGRGTSLKPAYEPIIVGMKPLDGTFAENALEHGVAGLNIDGSRIESGAWPWREARRNEASDEARNAYSKGLAGSKAIDDTDIGRWPANLLLDEEAAEMFPDAPGQLIDQTNAPSSRSKNCYGKLSRSRDHEASSDRRYTDKGGTNFSAFPGIRRLDTGSAARFFYCAKTSKRERGDGNNHPTVKPISLLKYLVTLLTPPQNAIFLDPFVGSGSTLLACAELGIAATGIEIDEHYCEIAAKRLDQLIGTGSEGTDWAEDRERYGMMQPEVTRHRVIDSFQGEYRFLSNFWIESDGTHVEGEYQASKVLPIAEHVKLMDPSTAKQWGKSMRGRERSDWREVNLDIMFDLVMNKFAEHLDLQAKLLSTGNAELIEGNTWGDTFYGMCNGEGENHLGKILMKVREMLR